MNDTTCIYRVHQVGGPEALQLDTVSLPEPRPNEVRTRVEGLSLNRVDLLWLANSYIETPPPRTPPL